MEKVKSAEEDMNDKTKEPEVKLFDFGSAEIKENVLETNESSEPLEGPKVILNLVHNDLILPPLNKQRDFASETDDSQWMIIPISFDGPTKRKNMSGVECWHYDGHVNTCVVNLMKGKAPAGQKPRFNVIMNYFVEKFMHHLKVNEGYIIHKKSIKLMKNKRYKDGKSGAFQSKTQPFKIPLHLRKEAFIESKKDFEEKKKAAEQANGGKPIDITLADLAKKAAGDHMDPSELKDIRMPGQQQQKTSAPGIFTKPQKPSASGAAGFNPFSGEPHTKPSAQKAPAKPMIVEIKDKPESIESTIDTDKGVLILMITCEQENSAADLDLDVSATELKLRSENYELNYKFEREINEEAGLKAKFNKKKHVLTLTLTLQS